MANYLRSLDSPLEQPSVQSLHAAKRFEECFAFGVISRTERTYSFEDANFSFPNHCVGSAPFVLIDRCLHGPLPTVCLLLQANTTLPLPAHAEFRQLEIVPDKLRRGDSTAGVASDTMLGCPE